MMLFIQSKEGGDEGFLIFTAAEIFVMMMHCVDTNIKGTSKRTAYFSMYN